MNFIPIIAGVWGVVFILSLYYCSKPSKLVVKKYGQPIYHFSTKKCWKTLPIRGSLVSMDFFSDFIVISEGKNEVVLCKDFKNYKFYGSYVTLVFEFTLEEKTYQILLTKKQKQLLEEFFV